MERLKYEEQFKKQLEAREIKPSEGSWNKLDERLDNRKNTGNRKFWWLSIAASLVGGILILSLVFKNETSNPTPRIVDSPSKISTENKIEKSLTPQINENTKIASEDNSKDSEKAVQPSKSKIQNELKNKHANSVAKNNEVQEKKQVIEVQTAKIIKNREVFKNEILTENINNVLAEISSEQKENNSTDAEVDALLMQAAERISKERKYSYNPEKVDATALLQDVEMEMDNSFREKVFEILKEGFNKARSAVANRNN